MSVFDTRRANLRQLMQQWGGPTSLAAKLGHSNGSYVAQLAGPRPSKDVSEKVARAIERKLDLPDGWMDRKNVTRAGEPDTGLLVDIVALVHDRSDATRAKLTREVFTEIVQLAYEHAQLTGSADRVYIGRLIALAAKR